MDTFGARAGTAAGGGEGRLWVDLRRSPRVSAPVALPQVPPANLDLAIIGQLALAQLALGGALEPGPLEVFGFGAPLGADVSGNRRWNAAPGPRRGTRQLDGLPLDIPAGAVSAFLGKWKSRRHLGLGGSSTSGRGTTAAAPHFYFRSTHGRVNLTSGTTRARSPAQTEEAEM
jgi:hypothetical protein